MSVVFTPLVVFAGGAGLWNVECGMWNVECGFWCSLPCVHLVVSPCPAVCPDGVCVPPLPSAYGVCPDGGRHLDRAEEGLHVSDPWYLPHVRVRLHAHRRRRPNLHRLLRRMLRRDLREQTTPPLGKQVITRVITRGIQLALLRVFFFHH